MRIRMGELLVKAGVISSDQLSQALSEQRLYGGKIGDILVRMNFLSEDVLVRALSKQLGLPRASIPPTIDASFLGRVPLDLLEELGVVPLGVDGEVMAVAMADPLNVHAVQRLEAASRMKVAVSVAAPGAIAKALRELKRLAAEAEERENDGLPEAEVFVDNAGRILQEIPALQQMETLQELLVPSRDSPDTTPAPPPAPAYRTGPPSQTGPTSRTVPPSGKASASPPAGGLQHQPLSRGAAASVENIQPQPSLSETSLQPSSHAAANAARQQTARSSEQRVPFHQPPPPEEMVGTPGPYSSPPANPAQSQADAGWQQGWHSAYSGAMSPEQQGYPYYRPYSGDGYSVPPWGLNGGQGPAQTYPPSPHFAHPYPYGWLQHTLPPGVVGQFPPAASPPASSTNHDDERFDSLEEAQRRESVALRELVELLIEKGVISLEEYLARLKG